MSQRIRAIILGALLSRAVLAQDCKTETVQSSAPSDDKVALQSWSYCGGALNVSAWIANVCFNKQVSLSYTDSTGKSTPLDAVSLSYSSDSSSSWQIWSASTPVYIQGISNLVNLTFNAVDLGQIYTARLDTKVVASGAAAPTTSAPKPYASPKGFSQDITDWLSASNSSQAAISKTKMFANINIKDAAPGTVIAAQSYSEPDYAYDWVRDSSLTMEVVNNFYNATSNKSSVRSDYEKMLFQYAAARAAEQTDPNLQTGLGEPKFFLNNSVFTGPWGRPQNDGPATAAITLMEFATAYMAGGGSMDTIKQKIYDSTAHPDAAPVQKDLLFVASNWTSSSYDLWEEEEGDHFYTRMVQRRALLMGSKFATSMGDSATAGKLDTAAKAITVDLPNFYDAQRNLILYEYGPVLFGKWTYKDIAVILGVLHGYAGDGVFSYTNDQVLASAYQIATSFLFYGVANTTKDSAGQVLGIPIGRYPEDIYNGVNTSVGNPWYLCTAAMAEEFYRAANEYQSQSLSISITNASLPFWQYFAPDNTYSAGQTIGPKDSKYSGMIDSLKGWGDAFMRRVKYHTPTDNRLAEEFHRDSGVPKGAADLTWSYASVITASIARAQANGDGGYLSSLADPSGASAGVSGSSSSSGTQNSTKKSAAARDFVANGAVILPIVAAAALFI